MFTLNKTTNFFQTEAQMANMEPNLDWDAAIVIDVAYIAQLREKMNGAYLPPKSSWEGPQYHETDLKWAYVSNTKKNETYQRHNPFTLRLPHQLEGYERLYQHTRIYDSYGSPLTRLDASKTYLNFLREYNSAYITYLEAINRSGQAIAQMKELFSSDKMFIAAKVKLEFLDEKIKKGKPVFLLALLAYLTLDIVFSPDKHISTAARVRALEFLQVNFDIEKVAKAFEQFNLGYYLPYDNKDEPAYDLLPKSFISEAYERGTVQNNIFLKNKKINEIFQIQEKGSGHPSYNLDLGFSQLITKHPQEALQVLHSLLRLPGNPAVAEDRELIFLMIIHLVKLDLLQKGEIFGSTASYRNGGETKPGLSSRVDWATGHQAFGDEIAYRKELERLSKDDLITRLLLLEREMVDAQGRLNKDFITSENDPKGYFAILQLRPDTSEDLFEDMLKRSYRVLSLKYHPDKGGTKEQFQKLEEAYRVLSDPIQRNEYRTQRNENANSFRR